MKIPAIHKKIPGIISFTPSNLTFHTTSPTNPFINIPLSHLKSQFINTITNSNSKIILKLELINNTFVNFNFNNINDREQVKNIISGHISNNSNVSPANQPITSTCQSTGIFNPLDILSRQSLLSKNIPLAKLHKQYVVDQNIITENDFWSTRQQSLQDFLFTKNQQKGTSSSLLSDIKPTGGDGSDIKYTLTPEIIHSIFIQYPAVHAAYKENVPDKINEKDFWTRYFSSQYFYRKRQGISMKALQDSDDLFDKYESIDDDDNSINPKSLIFNSNNSLLDLTTTAEDHIETGNRADVTMRAGSVRESLSLIRKFNRHSEIVLKTAIPKNKKPRFNDNNSIYLAETELVDLEIQKQNDQLPLQISNSSQYFPGAADDLNSQTSDKHLKSNENTYKYNVNSNISDLTLDELSSLQVPLTIASMMEKRRQDETQDMVVSESLLLELKRILSSADELFRHFWAISDKTKAERIITALIKLINEAAEIDSTHPVIISLHQRLDKIQTHQGM